MITDLVNVLAEIANGIRQSLSAEEVEKAINKRRKIKRNVIAAAYSWVYEKMLVQKSGIKPASESDVRSIRIFSEEEVAAIGLHNYNNLLHFYNTGLIDEKELETVIERLLMFPEGAVDNESVTLMILSVFLNLDKLSLPGSRYLLYSSDTIN